MESIGSFAENLILNEVKSVQSGEARRPIMTGQKPTPDVPDISTVEVPKNFMAQVLGESVEEEPEQEFVQPQEEVIEYEETPPNYLTEDTASELISLLREVKDMLSEVTTAGMTGMNFGKSTYKYPKDKTKDRLRTRLNKLKARRSK